MPWTNDVPPARLSLIPSFISVAALSLQLLHPPYIFNVLNLKHTHTQPFQVPSQSLASSSSTCLQTNPLFSLFFRAIPQPGIEPAALQWKLGISTPRPPGKSPVMSFLTASSRCSSPYFTPRPQTRKLGRHLDHSPPVGLIRPSFCKNIFIIFTLLSTPKYQDDSYKSVPELLGLICLDLSWGSLITYPNTPPAQSRLTPALPFMFPKHPRSLIKLHLHPWECRQPPMPGNLPRGTFQGQLNVTTLLPSSLWLSQWWTHGTSYKFPCKSSQITFEHLLCNRCTVLWAGKDKNN